MLYKKFFVSGHSGLVGAELCSYLVEKGYEVCGYSRRILPDVSYQQIQGDIMNYDLLKESLKEKEVVIHAAAQLPGFKDKGKLWQTNVEGTQNIFKASVKNKISVFVFISSETAYAPPAESDVFETHKIGGFDLYGKSKAHSENWLQKEAKKHEIKLIIIRPSQVYGLRDNNGFTQKFRNLLLKKFIFQAWKRDTGITLIYVKDLVKGIHLAAINGKDKEAYNLSDPKQWSLKELNLALDPKIPRSSLIELPVLIFRLALSLRWFLLGYNNPNIQPKIRTYSKGTLTGSIFLGGPFYRSDKARKELGFKTDYTPLDVLPELPEVF
jgi:nucleoside-diphosphate-sugar epimerase